MGDNADNVIIRTHRSNTSPPLREHDLQLHRGQSIDTTSPNLTVSAWNDLRVIVQDNGSDADMHTWASDLGGAFGTWWAANVEAAGTRWTQQIRDQVNVSHIAP